MPMPTFARGRRAACRHLSAVGEHVTPPALAAGALLRALVARRGWLPPGAPGLAYELSQRLRLLPDDTLGNRWLHHRWLAIHDEMWADLRGAGFVPASGFSYLCLGPGAINTYAFSLLTFLAGAAEVRLVEPEMPAEDEEWRQLWGLQELILRLLTGSVNAGAHGLDTTRIDDFVDVDALFFGHPGRDPVRPERVHIEWTGLEDADLPAESVDLASSRSVLEHVGRFDAFADSLARALRAGGVVYHDIDLTAHSEQGPFTFYYSESPSPSLNELRLVDHVAALQERGFDVAVVRTHRAAPFELDRNRLASRFARYSDDDLLTTRAVLAARKR